MFRRMLIFAALTAVGCGAVSAQSVQQVFQDNGLIGAFAHDCSKRPSPDNIYTVYSLEPRGVRRVYYDRQGKQSGDAHIISALLMSGGQVVYQQELVDKRRTHMTVVLMKAGDGIRVWRSQRADGAVLVQDGKILANNKATVWQFRCYGARPGAAPGQQAIWKRRTGADPIRR